MSKKTECKYYDGKYKQMPLEDMLECFKCVLCKKCGFWYERD